MGGSFSKAGSIPPEKAELQRRFIHGNVTYGGSSPMIFSRDNSRRLMGMAEAQVRKGMPSTQLDKQQFRRVFFERFYDPAFESLRPQIEQLMETAWEAYDSYRKSPRTAKAGPG